MKTLLIIVVIVFGAAKGALAVTDKVMDNSTDSSILEERKKALDLL